MKQISVFVENKPGRVSGFISALSRAGVNLRAISIADAAEYGIVRIIADDPEKAQSIIRDFGLIVRCSNVLAIPVDDKPGGLAVVLSLFADNDVSISYMYSFVSYSEGHAIVVMNVDAYEKAARLLSDAGMSVIE